MAPDQVASSAVLDLQFFKKKVRSGFSRTSVNRDALCGWKKHGS